MDSDKIQKIDSNSFEIRCSASCTRAGVTALILATIAIWMLFSFRNYRAFNALGEYVSLRLSLIDNLEIFEQDQCWKELVSKNGNGWKELVSKNGNDSPEKWPFIKLLAHKCNKPPIRGVVIGTKLSGLETISKILVKLFDRQFLKLASSYTYGFSRSIYKWANYRDRLMSKEGGDPMKGISWGKWKLEKGKIKLDVIDYDSQTSIFENINLEKIRLLAKYELPNLSELENLKRKYTNISISSVGVPMTFTFGSVFVEFALCFVLIYFWLFQCEAKYSEAYPTAGTLFGVFGRRHLNHMIFLLLIAFPPIAASLLAFLTYPIIWLNIIPAAITVIVSTVIAYETRKLTEKSIR